MGKNYFSPSEWIQAGWPDASKRKRQGKCTSCIKRNVEYKDCLRCGVEKQEGDFADYAWNHPKVRVCKACVTQKTSMWHCMGCLESFEKKMFTKWLAPRACKTKNDGRQRCNKCMEQQSQA